MTLTFDVINKREFSIWYLKYGYKVLVTAAVAGACDQKVILIGCVRGTNTWPPAFCSTLLREVSDVFYARI